MKRYQLPFTLLALLLLALGHIAFAQQLPAGSLRGQCGRHLDDLHPRRRRQNRHAHGPDRAKRQYLDRTFKGPYQSGGIEGTMNVRHIVFRTKTRNVLTFRGMVDGNTMEGNFGIRGHHGTWEGRRAD